MVPLLLLLGTMLRFLLVPLPGFRADVAFWKGWGLAVADKGIVWLVRNTNFNYPPGFAYILYLINKIYALFANPAVINDYWADNNLLYLFLTKSLTIAADLVIVYLIIRIAKKLKSNLGPVLALVYFFNPATLYDGVFWGQVDQFGVMLFLANVYLLLEEKYRWAAIVFIVSFMMKFQNIIFIPIIYLYIYKKSGWKELMTSLAISCVTFLIVITPFWLFREMEILVRLLTINSDWFPFYSLNAFNGWWIASGLKGLTLVDKGLVLGLLNAKQVGLLLFSLSYFISCIILWLARKENLFQTFILSLSWSVFSFFHLLTQSHERYLFPLLVFLLIYAIFIPRKELRRYSIFYLLFTVLFFINMYLSMFFNYPDQVIWPFSKPQTVSMTWYLAVFQIIIFLYFFIVYIWPQLGRAKKYLAAALAILIAAVIIKNLPYIFHRPVSLLAISPVNYKQDYSVPMFNRTLNSAGKPFDYERISANYYFYTQAIASHANSEITYRLGRRFSRLQTDYGLDTEADVKATVYFSVWGDGRELFKSGKKGRFDNPSTMNVDIRGINELTLKIDKAGESIYGAHADWLNPTLIR